MTAYLISFPSAAMNVPEAELADVAATGHAVIQQAKDAGVFAVACRCAQEVREFPRAPLV